METRRPRLLGVLIQTRLKMTRQEIIAGNPEAQAWFALSDDTRIDAARDAKEGAVWQNLKTFRQVKIESADRWKITVEHATGKVGTIQTHYFAYDYFPVKEMSREEKIQANPNAANWFDISAADRSNLLDEEVPGNLWENLNTKEVVKFRDHRIGKSDGPCSDWKDGLVIVETQSGSAKRIQDTDFIFNFFPQKNTPTQKTNPNEKTQHSPQNANLQPIVDSNSCHGISSDSAQKGEVGKVDQVRFKPVKLTRKESYKAYTRYRTLVRRRDLNEDITVCGLCANTGAIQLQKRVGAINEPLPACEVPCICPNGQCAPWNTPGVPRGPL